jgi:primosomal protein N'
VAIQTRRSNDAVLEALRSGDVSNIESEDEDTARLLGLPPFRATATIGGSGGADFATSLREEGVRLAAVADGFVVDAGSHDELYELLARGKRPSKALRIAISP